jgi:putative membrane protein
MPGDQVQTQAPGGGRFDEAGDATRRTRLANERTYLAWWRTGLTAFAVSLGSGKLVPVLTKQTRWPYVVVGVGFALLGVVFVAYGFVRQRMVERAVARGEYVRPDERLVGFITLVGILLGLGLLVIVVVQD